MLNLLISIIIENFEYLSVKSDLINKINNMKTEEEAQRMTLRERLERVICCWRKKPLRVIPKKGEDNDDNDGDNHKLDIDDEDYLDIMRMRDQKLQQRESLNFF